MRGTIFSMGSLLGMFVLLVAALGTPAAAMAEDTANAASAYTCEPGTVVTISPFSGDGEPRGWVGSTCTHKGSAAVCTSRVSIYQRCYVYYCTEANARNCTPVSHVGASGFNSFGYDGYTSSEYSQQLASHGVVGDTLCQLSSYTCWQTAAQQANAGINADIAAALSRANASDALGGAYATPDVAPAPALAPVPRPNDDIVATLAPAPAPAEPASPVLDVQGTDESRLAYTPPPAAPAPAVVDADQAGSTFTPQPAADPSKKKGFDFKQFSYDVYDWELNFFHGVGRFLGLNN